MSRVLVTGYSGFIGWALSPRLRAAGRQLVPVVRAADSELTGSHVLDINPNTEWNLALHGVDQVVHLAARVHVLRDSCPDPLQAFRWVNTAGTLHLARCSAKAGVRRFVYLSSIKVNGEATHDGFCFTPEDIPAPQDPYARSKCEAEIGLRRIAAETGMELVIIRPPLVYGPGVKANFLKLMRWVDKGVPLPLASIHNRRSLLALDNLCDFIRLSLEHPAAAGETFLLSDGEDISTPDLIRRLAFQMGRQPRLFPFPPALMHFVAQLLRRQEITDRLLSSLQVDSGKARRLLGWTPPLTLDGGLQQVVDWYRQLGGQ